jgi:hypothetical protein
MFVLAALVFGPLALVPSGTSSVDCGSPEISVSNGARPADEGMFVVYKAQIVTIRGTGWSSCTQTEGGCIQPSRPAPVTVALRLVRATATDAAAPPSSWEEGARVIHLGTVAAGDDYAFVIDQVTMPTNHGHFMLEASAAGEGQPRAIAYVTVL